MMHITWTIEAVCDEPPSDEWLLGAGFEGVATDLADDVHAALLDSGASYTVAAAVKVEP